MKIKSAKWLCGCLAAVWLSVPAAWAQGQPQTQTPTLLTLDANALIGLPEIGDYDLFTHTVGFEAHYRYWFQPRWGASASVGLLYASVEKNSRDVSAGTLDGTYDGDALWVPLGGSVLYKLAYGSQWNLDLELGVRYVHLDASIDYTPADGGEPLKLKVDDGWVGLIALEWDGPISERVWYFLGGGYQFDLKRGDLDIGSIPGRDSELQQIFFRAGLRFAL